MPSVSHSLFRGAGRRPRQSGAGGFLRAAELLEERIVYRIPSDPYMKPPVRIGDPPNPQWNMEKIQALAAWDLFGGSRSNVVAVMDYGIDYTHEDFGSSLSGVAGNLWDRGRVFASYAKRGYDEINFGSAATQPDGATRPATGEFQGNHAAGIIGAVTNNRLGVSGINWQIQLYSSKIVDGTKTPTVGVIRTAIDHIIAMRSSAQSEQLVRSVAYGWSTTTDFGDPMPEFRRLVAAPLADPAKGILVTVPAGDSGSVRNYPSWYAPVAGTPASIDNVLIVGATNENDQPWANNSNTDRIEIYAPGVGIISAGSAGSGYSTVSGTRQAAAHVSGAIALVYEAARVNGRTLTWQSVRDAILNGADRVNGIRRLNVMGALRQLNLDTRPPGNGPILTITGGSAAEGNSGLSSAAFTVTMDRTYSTPVTFKVRVSDGTAQVVDNDYITPSFDGTVLVTIPTGQKSASFSVSVVGDQKIETDETITATLIDTPTDATVAVGSATWTIFNDDAYPVVSIAGSASLPEGSSNAAVTQLIAVKLSMPSPLPVTVTYAITPGTATAGADYVVPTSSTVRFAANQTTQWIPVGIVGDRLVEADETFTVALSSPVNATLGTASATVTIADDETPTVSVRAVQAAARVGAVSRMVFTVSLSAPAIAPVTVNVAAMDGTAVNGTDYTLPAGTLTFAAGEVSKTVVVVLAPRRAGQAYPKTFTLKLSGVAGGKFASGLTEATAVGTIL